jgi:hypothetical protein
MTDNNTKREFLKFHDERGVPDLQKLDRHFRQRLPNFGVGLGTMGRSERCFLVRLWVAKVDENTVAHVLGYEATEAVLGICSECLG